MNTEHNADNGEIRSASAAKTLEVAAAIIAAVQDEGAADRFWREEDELLIIPIAGTLTRGQAMLVEAVLQRDHGGIVRLEHKTDGHYEALVPHLNPEI